MKFPERADSLRLMEPSKYRVRRATLDDLTQLTAIWQSMRLPADELSKRVTEFQVTEGPDGKVLGAVGLQVTERQARIHSEGFSDFSVADHLRLLLWERVQAVARNHGLLRLWTHEKAPFWSHCGLSKADEESIAKMPAQWRGEKADWLTLKLREDIEAVTSLDKEFAMFMESEKQRTARAFQHARILKGIATLIALGLLVLVVAGAFFMIRHNQQLHPR